jgi:hypothetical protein
MAKGYDQIVVCSWIRHHGAARLGRFCRAVTIPETRTGILKRVRGQKNFSLKGLHLAMKAAQVLWDLRDSGELCLGYVDLCGLKPGDQLTLCNYYSGRVDPELTHVTVKSIAPNGWTDQRGGWYMDDNPDIRGLTLAELYRNGLVRTYRIVLVKAAGGRTLITAGFGAPVVYRGWRPAEPAT